MNIVIPLWLMWAVVNLAALLLLAWYFWDRFAELCLQHAAELQTRDEQLVVREAYHVGVYERMQREAAELQAQLDQLQSLWLVGRHVRGNHWDVQGIFATREQAIAACKNVRYFLFPLDLNISLPEESTTPFKLEYPKEAE